MAVSVYSWFILIGIYYIVQITECKVKVKDTGMGINTNRVVRSTHHLHNDDNVNSARQMSDMLFNGAQLKTIRRHKRKAQYGPPDVWWPTSIKFKVDETVYNSDQIRFILEAIKMWQEGTCINFRRERPSANILEPHLLFTSDINRGCNSFVGRQAASPGESQKILVNPATCMNWVGEVAHEIGYALGFFTEHSRFDRDSYVKIRLENARPDLSAIVRQLLFGLMTSETRGLPYDLGSIMHFSSTAFSKDGISPTIETLDPNYMKTIGQRTEISFLDLKLVNQIYCKDVCPPLPCEGGGFPNPRDCSKCKCPDHLCGHRCERMHLSSAACPLAGEIDVSATGPICINSPNYSNGGYTIGETCTWKLKAPSQCKLRMRFIDPFDVLATEDSRPCQHWVEIRFGPLDKLGPRFCGNSIQQFGGQSSILSSSNEVMILFRANPTGKPFNRKKGFMLCFNLENDGVCPQGHTIWPTKWSTPRTWPTTRTWATTRTSTGPSITPEPIQDKPLSTSTGYIIAGVGAAVLLIILFITVCICLRCNGNRKDRPLVERSCSCGKDRTLGSVPHGCSCQPQVDVNPTCYHQPQINSMAPCKCSLNTMTSCRCSQVPQMLNVSHTCGHLPQMTGITQNFHQLPQITDVTNSMMVPVYGRNNDTYDFI